MKSRTTFKGHWCGSYVPRLALLIMLVLLIALMFALSAGAKYGGFSPIDPEISANPDHVSAPGYISFSIATDIAALNNQTAMQSSAHGGYVTTTTKCMVCHSIHRATGIPTGVPSATNHRYLTGASACADCHAAWSPTASGTLVEWGQFSSGPHDSGSNPGCTTCHKGGIHGSGTSKYNMNNVFMLGSEADAKIAAELDQLAYAPASVFFVAGKSSGSATANNTWWLDGGAAAGTYIGKPGGIGQLPSTGSTRLNGQSYAAARSVATSYTCNRCHENTVMANLEWGVAFNRDVNGKGEVQATGHALPGLISSHGYSGTTVSRCGPCHVANPAGFPADSGGADVSRIAYGCDQCHDMIGVATNSTAWPHGNRGIKVYEWVDGERITTDIGAGNLWMYGGNIALATGQSASGTNAAAFADSNWQVLQGVTSGGNPRTGGPTGGAPETLAAATASTANDGFKGMGDRACLKCHIAVDSASLSAGAQPVCATRSGHAFNPGSTQQSQRIYLYR